MAFLARGAGLFSGRGPALLPGGWPIFPGSGTAFLAWGRGVFARCRAFHGPVFFARPVPGRGGTLVPEEFPRTALPLDVPRTISRTIGGAVDRASLAAGIRIPGTIHGPIGVAIAQLPGAVRPVCPICPIDGMGRHGGAGRTIPAWSGPVEGA